MTFSSGQLVGQHRLVEKIGEGGMGVVWKAVDTTLNRDVAIKFLPEVVGKDSQQLARFEREAKLLASLNHPNIATVHGFHEADGVRFLSMELVQGQTLAMLPKPMPIDEAIDLCRQVALAVEAAHEKGVIHRDLKPGNVMVRPDRTVKVLDFGLAKQSAASEARSSEDSTVEAITKLGGVVGTPGYLSPEQARGLPVDRRTDIWSFGCILYECLTGKRTFEADTPVEAISATLRSDPDFSALPPDTPPPVAVLLRRCLAKNPDKRVRDIGDARIELEEARSPSLPAHEASVSHEPRAVGRNRMVAIGLVVAALLVVATAWTVLREGTPSSSISSAVTRLSIRLPATGRLACHETSANYSKLGRGSPLLAVSPDGKRVTFCVEKDGSSRLYLRSLEQFEAEPIAGTEDARAPFFSPDSRWIGFLANNTLQLVSTEGGGARRICGVVSANFAGSWTPDGEQIVFSTNTGLWRVNADGGSPERLIAPRRDQGEVEYSLPFVLPNGSVLFTIATEQETLVGLLSLESGRWKPVIRDASNAQYIPTGHLVYAHAGSLWSVRFDAGAGETTGPPTPLMDGLHTTPSAGGAVVGHFSVSLTGALAFAPATDQVTTGRLVWVDRQGHETAIVEGPGRWEHPRLSPDGRRIAADILDERGQKDVYIFEIDRGQLSRLTNDGTNVSGVWSRDGQHLAGRSLRREGIISIATDFSGQVKPFLEGGPTRVANCFSPDGDTLFFTETGQTDTWAIGALTLGDDSGPRRLLGSAAGERWPMISPDGKWLAYVADERGRREVFVQPYPELSRRIRVSTNGGGEPMWAPDGRELFYRQDGQMFVVSVDTDQGFRPGVAQPLFDDPYDEEPGGHQHYGVSVDGERFLMVRKEEVTPTEVRVILDWLEDRLATEGGGRN